MSKSRQTVGVVLSIAAVLASATLWSSARGQDPAVLATLDLMKSAWSYAPCKQIKEGNQVGFTWVADGWQKECDETAENGWKAIDHLPMGKGPEEVQNRRHPAASTKSTAPRPGWAARRRLRPPR